METLGVSFNTRFNEIELRILSCPLKEMVREIQPFGCRLGIYNCIYNTI